MTQQQRRIVYFLGAGASVAANAYATVQHGSRISVPTQSNFWSTFLRFSKHEENKRIIESFLFRYFVGNKKVPTRLGKLARYEKLNPLEVEEVFTFISERIAAPATSAQLKVAVDKVWEALTEEIGNVFAKFPANASSKALYRKFMSQHVRSRDTIVSFNYDTIFERSLGAQKYFYDCVEEKTPSAIRLLKPHGSINWEPANKTIKITNNPSRSLVVAPTHLKFVTIESRTEREKENDDKRYGYLNQTEEMPKIWDSMERHMKGAKALVFIGYSFPVSDLYFSSVLRSVLASSSPQPKIIIVNPDAMAISSRLKRRFPFKSVDTFFDFQQFNQAPRVS